ncbi:MAG: hypothetical protein EBU90_30330 [Proteobacteria bacterium]|nr:hypothetical protein [Pseudomonadota bacterium]
MTLGNIVRFLPCDSDVPRAAIIVATHAEDPTIPDDGTASLAVMAPTAVEIVPRVPFSSTPQAGCWTWLTGAP